MAHGQTDYSMRMQALGIPLSGIIDDPISDAYRNPARVGGLEGTQVYIGIFPSRRLILPFPKHSLDQWWSRPQVLPQENINLDTYQGTIAEGRWYYPLSFSCFAPVLGDLPLSATLEVYVSGEDDLGAYDEATLRSAGLPEFEYVEYRTRVDPNHSNFTHALLDLALAGATPAPDSRSSGLRLTARYDAYDYAGANEDRRVRTGPFGLSELVSDYNYSVGEMKYEEMETSLSLGLFRSGSMLREIVFNTGILIQNREQRQGRTEIDDEDFDGNGRDPLGSTPRYRYLDSRFDSNRDYLSVRGSCAALLEWSPRVRSKHSIAWSEGRGDGSALFHVDNVDNEGFVSYVFNELIDYAYDGKIREYSAGSTVGFVDEVYDDVTLAVGAQGSYRYYEFDEDAVGAADVYTASLDTTVMNPPYEHGIVNSAEWLDLNIPVSLEWQIKRCFTARIGIMFNARRTDLKLSKYQSTEIMDYAQPFDDVFRREHRNIQYRTGVSSVIGFGFKLKDRLNVDLLDTSPGAFRFEYVTVRYRF
jgi:hypothetical protein